MNPSIAIIASVLLATSTMAEQEVRLTIDMPSTLVQGFPAPVSITILNDRERSLDIMPGLDFATDLSGSQGAGLSVSFNGPAGIYHVGSEKYFPVKPFVELCKLSPRKVLIFPRVEATIYGADPTPEEEKGLIKIERKNLSVPMFQQLFIAFLDDGADGIRPFNAGGTWLTKALADRSELQRFKTFIMPLLDIRFNSL